jgi:hypothetical protein
VALFNKVLANQMCLELRAPHARHAEVLADGPAPTIIYRVDTNGSTLVGTLLADLQKLTEVHNANAQAAHLIGVLD